VKATLIPSRLKWACRRGMLELDVLLNNFLEEAYPSLPALNQQQFQELLTWEDPQLYAWLMGHETNETDLNTVILLIRQHALTRFSR
jgi:antitoxin CptB